MWLHCMHTFLHNWVLLIVVFVLSTPLSIFIFCDDILLLIPSYCLVVLCRYLLHFCFLMDWCNLTIRFILFLLVVEVEEPFYRSGISCIVRLQVIFIDLFLACHLTFNWCALCISCRTFQLRGCFTFKTLPLQMQFPEFFGIMYSLTTKNTRPHSHGLGALQIPGWLQFS